MYTPDQGYGFDYDPIGLSELVRDKAKKRFLEKGLAYTQGFIDAHRGFGGFFAWLFNMDQYDGAVAALAELKAQPA